MVHLDKRRRNERVPAIIVAYEDIRLRPSGELTKELMNLNMEDESIAYGGRKEGGEEIPAKKNSADENDVEIIGHEVDEMNYIGLEEASRENVGPETFENANVENFANVNLNGLLTYISPMQLEQRHLKSNWRNCHSDKYE